MERYSHLQNMPNSPLTPLTPLSENTKFEFNFGGDGSLDMYIESVREEHRVEQQQKKLLQQANRIFHKKGCPLQPKHYSEEFLKIRDVFEAHEEHQGQQAQNKQNNCLRICCHHKEQQQQQVVNEVTPKAPAVKIIHTGATPTPTKGGHRRNTDYSSTPTNVRTPLKPRNHNVPQNIHPKSVHALQQQKLHEKCLRIIQQRQQQQQQQQHHHHHHNHHQQHHLQTHQNPIFRKASPVAAKTLCPHVAKILQQRGLSMYCGLFQREEIDLYTFHLLKLQDLHQMGITNQKHCAVLMHDIYYAGQYF